MIWERRLAVILVALALHACSGAPDAGEPEVIEEAAPLVASRILARGPQDEPGSSVDLFRTTDVAFVGDSLAIIDNGNDRVVLLDSAFHLVWSKGREGAGPGEFRAPFAVRPTPQGLMVIDIGNGRFTEFDRSGALLRTLKAPHYVSSFGIRSDGAVVMPSRLPTHFAYVLTEDGAEPFAKRDSAGSQPDLFGNLGTPPYVAVTAGDTVHIFDEVTFTLHKYDRDGVERMWRRLPPGVLDTVRQRTSRLVESLAQQGRRVVGSTQARELQVSADGRLLLLVSAGLTVGFVIDPHTYLARRITIPENTTEWAPLRRAGSGVLSGDRITVLSADSLFVYRLTSGTE